MLINSRAFALSVLAMATSIFMADLRPAIAQSANVKAPLIQASFVYNYARYYAPYAIQAAAAYLPVSDFDATRSRPVQNGYAADVDYAAQNIFTDERVRGRARDALKAWRYQFGSDSYLGCYDPTDSECQAALRRRHWFAVSGGPSFQVWTRTRSPQVKPGACTEVSIAFRGTAGNVSDWISNGNQLFGSAVDDYYQQLRRNVDGIISSIQDLDCYKRARFKPQIVSTGHSLGGGLAQLAALANKPNRPRIAKVFAFDPSPVTGAKLVKAEVLAANARGLTIDRIYQEGEVLSRYLSLDQQYPSSSSACGPLVRTVRVDAVPPGSPIQLHGMPALAGQMVQLSYNGETQLAYQAPPSPINCRVRYRSPTNEDGELVASVGARRMLLASANNYTGYTDQLGASYRIAEQQGGTRLRRGKIHGMAFMAGGRRNKKLRVAHSL